MDAEFPHTQHPITNVNMTLTRGSDRPLRICVNVNLILPLVIDTEREKRVGRRTSIIPQDKLNSELIDLLRIHLLLRPWHVLRRKLIFEQWTSGLPIPIPTVPSHALPFNHHAAIIIGSICFGNDPLPAQTDVITRWQGAAITKVSARYSLNRRETGRNLFFPTLYSIVA